MGNLLWREVQRASHYQWNGNSARIHDEHVLQAKGRQLAERQDFIDGVNIGGHSGCLL